MNMHGNATTSLATDFSGIDTASIKPFIERSIEHLLSLEDFNKFAKKLIYLLNQLLLNLPELINLNAGYFILRFQLPDIEIPADVSKELKKEFFSFIKSVIKKCGKTGKIQNIKSVFESFDGFITSESFSENFEDLITLYEFIDKCRCDDKTEELKFAILQFVHDAVSNNPDLLEKLKNSCKDKSNDFLKDNLAGDLVKFFGLENESSHLPRYSNQSFSSDATKVEVELTGSSPEVVKVCELFPHLSEVYVTKLLKYYSTTEELISAVLEGNLPPEDAIETPEVTKAETTMTAVTTRRDQSEAFVAPKQIRKDKLSDKIKNKILFSVYDDEYDDSFTKDLKGETKEEAENLNDSDELQNEIKISDEKLLEYYLKNPALFLKSSRKSKERAEMKGTLGLSDEQIEGWGVLFDRRKDKDQLLQDFSIRKVDNTNVGVVKSSESQRINDNNRGNRGRGRFKRGHRGRGEKRIVKND